MTWCYHMQGSSSKKPTLTQSDSEDEDDSDEELVSKLTTLREPYDIIKFLTERGEEELSESMFDKSGLPNFSTLNTYPLHLSVLECLCIYMTVVCACSSSSLWIYPVSRSPLYNSQWLESHR